MATSPLFTVTFDVRGGDRLSNPEHFPRVSSVLPPAPPGRWFHVVLRTATATSTVTLAVRDNSLNLEGFRSSDGTWWELGKGLIPGAAYVGFGGTYRDLVDDAGRRAGVALGPQQMMQAANVLAARTRADVNSAVKQRQARDAVVLLLLKVREAAWSFTATFDVSSGDNYGSFIAGIRSRLGNPRHFSHNRPVLPPVEPDVPPRRWLYVVLRTQTGALTLATRADNLYLEGFRSSDGTWWELTRGLIPGATYVGFGGTYRDLLGDTDNLTGVTLGPQQMTQAVNVLAARTRADLASGARQQKTREAVAALLLMVHEATRFQSVSGFVAGLMHRKSETTKNRETTKNQTITTQMKKQVNGWQDLSAALLRTDASPAGKFTPFKDMDVKTVEKAAETVGILLFVEVPGGMTAAKALQLFRGTGN